MEARYSSNGGRLGSLEQPQEQHQPSFQAPGQNFPYPSSAPGSTPRPAAPGSRHLPPLGFQAHPHTMDSPPPVPQALCPGRSPDPRTPPFELRRGPCATLQGLSPAPGHPGLGTRVWPPRFGLPARDRAPGAVSSFSAFSACLSKPGGNTKDPPPRSLVSPSSSSKELQTRQESASSGWQGRPLKARKQQTLTVLSQAPRRRTLCFDRTSTNTAAAAHRRPRPRHASSRPPPPPLLLIKKNICDLRAGVE